MFLPCEGDQEPFENGSWNSETFLNGCSYPPPVGVTDSQRKITPYLVSASTTRYGVIFLCPTSRPCAVGREILPSNCRDRRPRLSLKTNGYRKFNCAYLCVVAIQESPAGDQWSPLRWTDDRKQTITAHTAAFS